VRGCVVAEGAPVVPGLVSAIVPVHNRPEMVAEAVASVLAQTYRPIEILLVDDGSTDGTGAVLTDLATRHSEIQVITQANAGAGAAREAGRLRARGEFIQYLDSDDRLLPEKFALQVQALRQHPDCGAAYCVTRLIDAEGKVLVEPYKWTGRAIDQLLPALLVDRWWNTQTPLYRRSVTDAAGEWPRLRMSEDWAYEARIAAGGVLLTWVPKTLCETRRHDGARLTRAAMDAPMIEALASLQTELMRAANLAGVDRRTPEMRHLGRWAFLLSRQAAQLNMPATATSCLELASQAAAQFPRDRHEIALFRLAAWALGWRLAGQGAVWMQRLGRRRGSARTLKSSRQ